MIFSNNSIGIDEVGRWPLAGPVGVGGVFCLSGFFSDPLPSWTQDIQDSKKLSSWQREYLASCILSDPNIICATTLVSASYIDRYGIVAAIRKASLEVIEEIRGKIRRNAFDKTIKDLSTSLHFPSRGLASQRAQDDKSQGIIVQLDGKTDYGLRQKLNIPLETIIKWDQKIRHIAAASIIAKVQRDRYMIELSHKKKYQPYRFDRHKGYGTLIHRKAISQYGLSDQHRKSFCRNIVS
jgi:ribonuclease HII